MAVAQYNRYIWLVDTIRSAGKITIGDIDLVTSNAVSAWHITKHTGRNCRCV